MLPLLEGVRILSVEQYGAGPFGTQFLADLGAEVIKIENPSDGGDMSRSVGPHFNEDLPETARSVFFQGLNRGKRSLTLDLGKPEGRAAFARLAATADAVATNLRGDVPKALGLDHAALASANPRIVCAHLSGYGRDGPRATWPGYDYLMQAEAGHFHLTGSPDGPPCRMGLSLIDLMTGVVMGLGLVSGVLRARATGEGADVDVSLFDLALFDLNYIAHWYLNAGAVTTRLPRSAHPSIVPCQAYRTQDGWIYLMCNKEKFWPLLCEKIGAPELGRDPRYARFPDRLRARDELTDVLDGLLSRRTTAEWLADFGGAIPAAPIHDVAQALDNPFVRERGMIETLHTPDGAAVTMLANPVRSSVPTRPSTPAPALGADTDAVLAEAGFAPAEIAALRAAGVV
jgi:crotonobetainyl-CoA:carnitine CoA-transferase CaiB-like acyl-CoA transferase